jgi:hypothetical protein
MPFVSSTLKSFGEIKVSSFKFRIQDILEKHGLGKVEEYLHSPKAKEVWKIIVKGKNHGLNKYRI